MNDTAANDADARLSLRIRQIRYEGIGIHSYELTDPQGRELPAFTAGAHIDVHLGEDLIRQYSLCNAPSERHRYVIAVLRDEQGRGGSRRVHDALRVGGTLTVSRPRNHFPLVDGAARVVLLAGGIGITPLKAMVHQLQSCAVEYELHYCARDAAHAAFYTELRGLGEPGQVHYHFDGGNPANGLDIAALLRESSPDTHVYYCGPAGFMKACAAATQHWPAGQVHCEHFKAPVATPLPSAPPPGGFAVTLARSGTVLDVGHDESLVDALQRAGVPVETSCQSGLCGTCKLRYLSGEVDHQDYILDAEERSRFLTACVSRARSPMLTLDL